MQNQEQNAKKVKRVNIRLSGDIYAQTKIIAVLKQFSFSKYLKSCIGKEMKADQKIIENLKINETKK